MPENKGGSSEPQKGASSHKQGSLKSCLVTRPQRKAVQARPWAQEFLPLPNTHTHTLLGSYRMASDIFRAFPLTWDICRTR